MTMSDRTPPTHVSLNLRSEGSDIITIMGEDGEEVGKFTKRAFGLMLAALREDLTREWRCQREDGSYGPPCRSEQEARDHDYPHRHSTCCWIVYYEEKRERAT